MGESFDHRPAGGIRESGKRCVQFIHNRMVVNYPQMSSVDFEVPINPRNQSEIHRTGTGAGPFLLSVVLDPAIVPQNPYGAFVLYLPKSPDGRRHSVSSYLQKMRVLALRTRPREDGVEGEKR